MAAAAGCRSRSTHPISCVRSTPGRLCYAEGEAQAGEEPLSYIAKTYRFGLLTPSSNTIQEPEFSAALPRNVSLHTARLGFRNIDAETMLRCVEELETESR